MEEHNGFLSILDRDDVFKTGFILSLNTSQSSILAFYQVFFIESVRDFTKGGAYVLRDALGNILKVVNDKEKVVMLHLLTHHFSKNFPCQFDSFDTCTVS